MPYKATNTKKFLDSRGLTYFSQQLNNYPDNTVIEAVVEGVQDALDEKLDAAQKGAANGVAPLDAAQKVPLANLSVMTGATNSAAGTSGLVPSSNVGDQNKFLKASGEWGIPAGTSIHQFVLDDMTNATGSYSHSTSLSAARATMKAVNIECSNPDAFLDAITITINNGSILLECNKVNGSSSILVTAVEGQTGEQLTVSQYAELVGKIGDITSLTTANKDSLTAAVNEIDSAQDTITSQVTNKIDKPVNVQEGKFLQTDSNGNAVWGDAASPTDVANAVTDWLEDNVPAGQTVTVDQSLTVSGAAADAKVVGDKIIDLKSAINPVINQANVFGDPQCTDTTTYSGTSTDNYRKWKALVYTLAHGAGTIYSDAYYFDNDGTNKPYLVQDFFPADIPAGTYYISMLVKANFTTTYYSLFGSVSVIGYPTINNSGGTNLVNKNVTFATLETAKNNYYRFTTSITVPDTSSYNHIRVMFYFNTTDLDVWVTEPYMSTVNGKFSAIGNKFESVDNEITRIDSEVQKTNNNIQDVTRALINPNNKFQNPQMLTHDDWKYITTDFTIESSENQEYGIFKVITGDTQPYIYQVFEPSDLPSGEYTFSFRAKASAPTFIRLYAIAYPTTADTGGSTIQLAEINITTDENTYKKTVTMPNVSTYDHVRILIYCGGTNKTYYLSEIYLAPTGVQNYASYVLNAIREAQASDIVTSSRLYGKTLYADGDSIAYGAGAGGVSYADLLATKYNMTLDKQAVNGGTMAYVSGAHCISSSVVEHYNNQDFVILDGGFNDYGSSVTIGSLPTSTEQPITTNPTNSTYIGGLEVAFQHIMNENPTAKIWLLIPHRIYKSSVKPVNGHTFQEFIDSARTVCGRYGVEIIDVWDNVNFPTYLSVYRQFTLSTTQEPDGDRVHPTLEGYQKFYMPYIEKMTR